MIISYRFLFLVTFVHFLIPLRSCSFNSLQLVSTDILVNAVSVAAPFRMSSSKQSLSSFPKHSSNSQLSGQTSSQASLTSAPSHSSKDKMNKKNDSPSPSAFLEGNSAVGGPCSLAIPITSTFTKPSNKQGFRFSLRRMLYNSPLVSQRRARSLSASNNITLTASTTPLRKKTSPSTCKLSPIILIW